MNWINISEKLPQTNDEYIVCLSLPENSEGTTTAMFEIDKGWMHACTGTTLADSVTHWMPFPLPPSQDASLATHTMTVGGKITMKSGYLVQDIAVYDIEKGIPAIADTYTHTVLAFTTT